MFDDFLLINICQCKSRSDLWILVLFQFYFLLCLCIAENDIPILQWSKLASFSPPYPFVVNHRWIDWTFLVTDLGYDFTDCPVLNIDITHEDSPS